MKNLFFALTCLLLLTSTPAVAARSVTLYLDGAHYEQELETSKGYLEMPLPPGIQVNSLRIKPVGVGEILRVEVVPLVSTVKPDKVRAGLLERRERLEARLKVLETREEIFKAAAKSQSGKAPRRSKNNPEPMETIRRGTGYALSQLEDVYLRRQRTEKDLREVEKRLAGSPEGRGSEGRVVRVWLSAKRGRVNIAFLRSDQQWKPLYDFRLAGDGSILLVQRAELPHIEKGVEIFVVPTDIASSVDDKRYPVAGNRSVVAEVRVPAERAEFFPSIRSALSFSFKNPAGHLLPAGEAACYWKGEFLGALLFPGAGKGDIREMVCGR